MTTRITVIDATNWGVTNAGRSRARVAGAMVGESRASRWNAEAQGRLPTGSAAKVSCLPKLFNRTDLVQSVRQILPTQLTTRSELETKPEDGDKAVFWGARQHTRVTSDQDLPPAAGF